MSPRTKNLNLTQIKILNKCKTQDDCLNLAREVLRQKKLLRFSYLPLQIIAERIAIIDPDTAYFCAKAAAKFNSIETLRRILSKDF